MFFGAVICEHPEKRPVPGISRPQAKKCDSEAFDVKRVDSGSPEVNSRIE